MALLSTRMRLIITSWTLVLAILGGPIQALATVSGADGCAKGCPCDEVEADEHGEEPCVHEDDEEATDVESHAHVDDSDGCATDCSDCACDSGIVVCVVAADAGTALAPFPTARNVGPPDPLAVGTGPDIFVPPRR